MNILITGATGYIGSRLITHLLDKGFNVRCMVRSPEKLVLPLGYEPEVAIADATDYEAVKAALKDIDVAYYLIHSLNTPSKALEELERSTAETFGAAAADTGVKRILYLGGLGSDDEELSPHLRSRQETGKTLSRTGIPVTEFRAGSVVGSGSLAFEILRYLTDRIPVMIAPRWLHSLTHPVGVGDVLYYLGEALHKPDTQGEIYEIGCPENMTYKEMMLRYATIRGLKRFVLTIPFLTPYLSSLWVNLVTPLPTNLARSLFESTKNNITADLTKVRRDFDHKPLTFEVAVKRALDKSESWIFDTERIPNLLERKVLKGGSREIIHSRGYIIEKRLRITSAPAENLFRVISSIGGKNRWPYADRLWSLRMFLDKLIGGKSRRYRTTPDELVAGEQLDFWRIQKYENNKRVLLFNQDMKIPGKAWLEFSLRELPAAERTLTMTAYFEPRGLIGILYWYSLYPLHALIFNNTLKRIIARAEKL